MRQVGFLPLFSFYFLLIYFFTQVTCTLLIRATSAFGRWSRSLPTVQGTLTYSYSLTHSLTLISMIPSAPPSLTPSLSPSAVFVITTVAGSSTSGSYSGDNGQATSAYLYDPRGVAVDSSGTSSSISYPMCLTLSPSRQRVHRRYT